MTDETEQNTTEQAPAAPKKGKRAPKPKVEKPEDGTDIGDEAEAQEDVYVAPRSRARLARAERLARIGGEA